eukprot:1997150-Rhodomonas_salina.1
MAKACRSCARHMVAAKPSSLVTTSCRTRRTKSATPLADTATRSWVYLPASQRSMVWGLGPEAYHGTGLGAGLPF